MWADFLDLSSELLDAISRIGGAVMEFLENDSLNAALNTLVVGAGFPELTTIEILFGSAIGIVLYVGVVTWIANLIIPN